VHTSEGITRTESIEFSSQFQWPRGLSRGSAVGRLVELPVRVPPRACMSVSCECSVLSETGPCFGLFIRPGEFY